MRTTLHIVTIIGILMVIAGVAWYVPALQHISDQAAVVVVPQLILGTLFGGLGLLLIAVSFGSMQIEDAVRETASRIAEKPAGNWTPAPRASGELAAMAPHLRTCPKCRRQNRPDTQICPGCGETMPGWIP